MTPTAEKMATLEQEIEPALAATLPDREKLRKWYRTMVTARHIDDREAKLYKQGKVFFLIAGAGHEAVQVALADFLRPGSDWFHLYYRDRALAPSLAARSPAGWRRERRTIVPSLSRSGRIPPFRRSENAPGITLRARTGAWIGARTPAPRGATGAPRALGRSRPSARCRPRPG